MALLFTVSGSAEGMAHRLVLLKKVGTSVTWYCENSNAWVWSKSSGYRKCAWSSAGACDFGVNRSGNTFCHTWISGSVGSHT